jgi:hypothetical protein
MLIMITRKCLALMHDAYDALDLTEMLCTSYISVIECSAVAKGVKSQECPDDVTGRIHSC